MTHLTLLAVADTGIYSLFVTIILILLGLGVWVGSQKFFGRHTPATSIDLFGGSRLVPVSNGFVSVRIPAIYQFGWQDGSLIISPRNARGASVIIHASLVIDDGEATPTQSYLQTWADQHDGTLETTGESVLVTATRDLDEQGEQFEVRHFIRGEGIVIATFDLHINRRHARPALVKRIERDIRKMLGALQFNVRRDTLNTPAERDEDAYLIDAHALAVTNVDRKDQEFINKWTSNGRSVAESYLAARHTERLTPETLDWIVSLWQTDRDSEKRTHHDLALSLGSAFGEHCVRSLEMRWGATAVDGRRELVLRHAPTNLIIFPFRIVLNEFQCARFEPLYTAMTSFIAMKRQQPVA